MIRLLALIVVLLPGAALAHPGHGDAGGLVAGLQHPLTGLDHVAAMIAVGLWAALKGGRALWLWPAAFVAVMLGGGVLGLAQLPLPHVEAAILASVVVLGLLVATAADLPLALGALIIGGFAVFHGYAHVAELPAGTGATSYLAGFALATAALHGLGIAGALGLQSVRWQGAIRAGGLACAAIGIGLAVNGL
jgi:urease accessory protein